MKKGYFAIILLFLASNCNREPEDTAEPPPLTLDVVPSELLVVASKVSTYADDEVNSYAANNVESIVAFNGADVKSFNRKTGEMAFKELTFEQLRSRIHSYTLTFYLGGKELFRSATIGYDTVFMETNSIYDDLVFVMRDSRYQSLYLLDGFPDFDWVAKFGGSVSLSKQQREANALKRKDEWALFINYFREADKLVE